MPQVDGKQLKDAPSGISTGKLNDGAVTALKLATDSVTNIKILAGAVSANKVDASVIVAAGSNPFTGDQSLAGFKLTNLGAPAANGDATNKLYVDMLASGIDVKVSVRAGTTVALPAYTRVLNALTANANGALPLIDGVSLVFGNRLLVKNETAGNAPFNGIYDVTQVGSAGTPWILTRSTDADTDAEVTPGMFTFIEEGTSNGTFGVILISPAPIVLGTTALTFTFFSGAGSFISGGGLVATGNVVAVGAGLGILVNPDDVEVIYGVVGEVTTVRAGDAAVVGALNKAARNDHQHQVVCAIATAVAIGDAAIEGVATTLARSDHKHSVASGVPVAVGTANSAGVAVTFARSDHVHDAPVQVTTNKNISASVTVADNDLATASTVAATPALGGYVGVRVNGVHYLVGDGTKIGVDCYFSGDAGATARAMSAIIAGDTLRWNGSVVGFQLAVTDKIDFAYEAL